MKSPRRPGIVVVDDDQMDRKLIQRSLAKIGLESDTKTFSESRAAVEFLEGSNDAHLVLLDLRMPEMSGLEVLDAFDGDKRRSGLVFFVMSTSERQQDIDSVYARGAAGYLFKSEIGENPAVLAGLVKQYIDSVRF